MNRIRQFASRHPIVFSFVNTLALILGVIIAAIVANHWMAESPGWYVAAMGVRIILIFLVLALLYGLGWLRGAGFTWLGQLQTWLLLNVLYVPLAIFGLYLLRDMRQRSLVLETA